MEIKFKESTRIALALLNLCFSYLDISCFIYNKKLNFDNASKILWWIKGD
jgi:DNA relaxase NicK